MFENLIQYPIVSQLLRWEAKTVVRDHDREPGLYVRLTLTGTEFPVFDSIPFVQVGEVRARFVDIAEDRLSVRAYFDRALRGEGAVEFGYDDQVLLRFPEPYEPRRVERLDETRLPRDLRYQDRLFGPPFG